MRITDGKRRVVDVCDDQHFLDDLAALKEQQFPFVIPQWILRRQQPRDSIINRMAERNKANK